MHLDLPLVQIFTPANLSTQTTSHLAWIPGRDQYGSYVEIKHVFKAMVDATVLRTNKYFYNTGIDVLYGNNSFLFDMVDVQ